MNFHTIDSEASKTEPALILCRGRIDQGTHSSELAQVLAPTSARSIKIFAQLSTDPRAEPVASNGTLFFPVTVTEKARLHRYPRLSCPVLALATAWNKPFNLLEHLTPGERTVIVSVQALVAGSTWLDGPLAHVLADGTLASYVPSGEPAVLKVPIQPELVTGHVLAVMSSLEGTEAERAHRCLLGYIRSTLPLPPAHLHLTGPLELSKAVALALTRQVHLAAELTVWTAPEMPLPPAWRRACQNLAIKVCTLGPKVSRPAVLIDITDLARPISPEAAQATALSLRRFSDILPMKLR